MAQHTCGGTILQGGQADDGSGHYYCDTCRAFCLMGPSDLSESERCTADDVPTGTDMERNRAAWDAGESAST